jgi:hypothetical protein
LGAKYTEGTENELDKIILEEQSKFYLERLLEKGLFKQPSKNYYVGAVLLSSIFSISWVVVTFFTGEIGNLLTSWWFYAGFFSPLLGLIFLKKLRDKTIDSILKIKPMLDPERWTSKYLNNYFREIFGSKYQFIPIIAAPILIFFVLYYNYYMGFMVNSFLYETVFYILTTFVYMIIGLIAGFCIGVGIILFNVGRHVRLTEEHMLAYDKMGNLTPMASLGLVNAFAFVLPITVFIPAYFENQTAITPLVLFGVIIFMICTFILFVYPVFGIHRGMVRMKTDRLKEIDGKILNLNLKLKNFSNKESDSSNRESIEKLQLQFDILKTNIDEVKSIGDWPISLSTIITFIGTLIVPLIPLILKYLYPLASTFLGV